MSTYGLKYKEIISKVGTVRVVCECLAKAESEELKMGCYYLLDSLVTGNPRYVSSIYRALIALLPAYSSFAVLTALQLLRTIQSEVEPIKELVSPLLGTTGSYHGEVRYEARLFIISLADRPQVASHLLTGLIRQLELAEKRTLADFIRQATAAETLDELVKTHGVDWVQHELVAGGVIEKLIFTLANVKHPESQRNASRALKTIAVKLPCHTKKIESALGPLVTPWRNNPDSIHEFIDAINADALLNNNITFTDQ